VTVFRAYKISGRLIDGEVESQARFFGQELPILPSNGAEEERHMKLSEAILLGSTLRPQIKGHLFADGRSCALGAAAEAIGSEPKDCPSSWEFVRREWPWTQALSFLCPACWRPRGTRTALDLIMHLNDFHGWTRQLTAGWVASVEPGEEAEPRTDLRVGDGLAESKEISAGLKMPADAKE
jgi:hypothetical protein